MKVQVSDPVMFLNPSNLSSLYPILWIIARHTKRIDSLAIALVPRTPLSGVGQLLHTACNTPRTLMQMWPEEPAYRNWHFHLSWIHTKHILHFDYLTLSNRLLSKHSKTKPHPPTWTCCWEPTGKDSSDKKSTNTWAQESRIAFKPHSTLSNYTSKFSSMQTSICTHLTRKWRTTIWGHNRTRVKDLATELQYKELTLHIHFHNGLTRNHDSEPLHSLAIQENNTPPKRKQEWTISQENGGVQEHH